MRIPIFFVAFILSIPAHSQTLIPFLKKNGKYIFVEAGTMKPVITTEFAVAGTFDKDGLAWVNDKVTDFFVFTDNPGFYIDKKGNIARSGNYELKSSYNEEGLATIVSGNKEGLVNRQGTVVIQPIWDEIEYNSSSSLVAVKSNNKWGYSNKTGRLQIPLSFDDAKGFYEQRAFVKIGDKWSIIDTTGKIVSHFKYKNDSWFSEGMALVTTDGKRWHNINLECKMLVPSFPYIEMNSFSAGLSSVKSITGKWGLMDKKMKLVVPFEYDSIAYFSWNEPYLSPAIKNGKWGAINQKGKTVVPFEYENILPFYDNAITAFQSNGMWGIIDQKGKVLIPAMYKEIEVLNSKYIMVSSGDKWAIADNTNKILTPFSYYPLDFNGSNFKEEMNLVEVLDKPSEGIFGNNHSFYIELGGKEYREK